MYNISMIKKTKIQSRSTKDDETVREIPLACADEKAAVEFMEKKRWGNAPVCVHCESPNVYKMTDSKTGERQADYRWRCRNCKKQYTVRIGTVFEDSRIELRHWCYGFWRAATSKKGVSALEIHRQTGLSYKSALFMLHRIRFAMSDSVPDPLKGAVEVDETYVGGKPRYKGQSKRGRGTRKQAVLAMVERNGRVKTKPVTKVTGKTVMDAIRENIDWNSAIITDENPSYNGIGKYYLGGHHSVCHSAKEYVRGEIHSNTVESFFALVKRSLNGIYHAVSKEHLPLYLAEREFVYNKRELEDGERTVTAIKAAEGKRLLYKQPIEKQN